MEILKKLRKALQKKVKTSSSNQSSEQNQELTYLLDELNHRLLDLERQILEIRIQPESLTMTFQTEEEYLENLQITFAEELYLELCKELGSDRIPFMGIA